MLPWVRTGMVVGVQPGPWMTRVGFMGEVPRHAARSLGAEMVRSKRRAKADIISALSWSPASEEESETRSSAYPRSETGADASLAVGIWKWRDVSVIASARSAMSKKAVHACGLETSPCGVPRSRTKVLGRSPEIVGLKP